MEGQAGEEHVYDNVSFIDEYPELEKKVWLRRLHQQRRLGETAIAPVTRIYQYPKVTEIRRPRPDAPNGSA